MKSVINLALNITESERRKRVILEWRTGDGNNSIGGQFDVTELVLMCREAFQATEQRV